MQHDIAILGPCRTAIGKFGGSLANVPAVKLGEIVIRESLKRAGVKPEQVDEVLFGNVIQAGLGQNPARQAARNAGLPDEVPASTLNNLCGSGLKTLNMAAAMINNGDAELMVVGGMENMSAAPYLLDKARFGYRMNAGTLKDAMISDGLTDAFYGYHMGMTAENVAEQFHVSREECDQFSYESQMKAKKAQEEGRFKEEIVPVHIKERKREYDFEEDEFPRHETTLEALAKLKPAFKKEGGVITAGNASGINDAAAAMVVMSVEKAKELGLKPMGILKCGVSVALDPAIMGMGPYFAIKKLMEKSGEKIENIELWELNEAFSSQSVAAVRDLGINKELVNVNGGAIALGHPIGCSGARILVTLLYEMEKRNLHKGVASLCVGGGMGVASLVERP